eukprot:TRINITY_DN10797_c1_g3_i1.p2 TRINITY_DN10797_c1_g3~~TRINITY_DN10797_c1_g3_i1.p2  ORF type:complete len:100 (+),score=3.36 TRINITY_DN10797_c1_g3_i1:322-621(+)
MRCLSSTHLPSSAEKFSECFVLPLAQAALTATKSMRMFSRHCGGGNLLSFFIACTANEIASISLHVMSLCLQQRLLVEQYATGHTNARQGWVSEGIGGG